MKNACRTIEGLREKMNQKRATVVALAKKAGCCAWTVQQACNGRRIWNPLADFIEQALEQHTFSRTNRGRR